MRYIDEFRDRAGAEKLAVQIRQTATRPWTIMEICGGQTHTIVKYGIDDAAARRADAGARTRLPGVRHAARDDRQGDRHRLAARRDLHLVRRHAPRSRLGAVTCSPSRPSGGDVRMVYSPLDAVKIARENPGQEGRVLRRRVRDDGAGRTPWPSGRRSGSGSTNFSMLVSHVLVPPAMEAILSSPDNRVQGFLAAGHVCAVMGYRRVRASCRKVPRAHRGDGLRAAGPAAGDPHDRQAARGRAA